VYESTDEQMQHDVCMLWAGFSSAAMGIHMSSIKEQAMAVHRQSDIIHAWQQGHPWRPVASSAALHLISCAHMQVTSAQLDKATGLWTVTSASGAKVRGRVLVVADGATSQ
jgi:hypothetical protein